MAVGAFILLFALWFGPWRASFNANAHNWTAIFMFVFLFIATARSSMRSKKKAYRGRYRVLAWLMALAAVGVFLGSVTTGWGHAVFTLEATEIFIFATYWILQTREHWPPSIAALAKEPDMPEPDTPGEETTTTVGPLGSAWEAFKQRED